MVVTQKVYEAIDEDNDDDDDDEEDVFDEE